MGQVVMDFDYEISNQDYVNIFSKIGALKKMKRGEPVEVLIGGKIYSFLIKQITYLGNPHSLHKKRIQIPKTWKKFLSNEETFIVGVYKYLDSVLLCFFDKHTYKFKKGNNSSAHVHTIDLLNAQRSGTFQKTDFFGNKLIITTLDGFAKSFKKIRTNSNLEVTEEIQMFNNFFDGLDKKWNGIKSYKEMIAAEYTNAYQGEWPGFFLEYKFENYAANNSYVSSICSFTRNKKSGDLDFDLFFIKNNFLGDLKSHDIKSNAILGNDYKSIKKALETYERFWYVVLDNVSEKDSRHRNMTTIFWNTQLIKSGKKDQKKILSYETRMKNNTKLVRYWIAEINRYNFKYLEKYKQGKNSDGKPRKDKVRILKKDVNNFLIHQMGL